MSSRELEVGGRDTQETCVGAATLPSAAEAGTKDSTDDIQGKSTHRTSVNDPRTRSR